MDNKETLDIGKSTKDNTQNKGFEYYEILYCDYSFNKDITNGEEVNTNVLGGNIHVALRCFPLLNYFRGFLIGLGSIIEKFSLHDNYEESMGEIYFEQT